MKKNILLTIVALFALNMVFSQENDILPWNENEVANFINENSTIENENNSSGNETSSEDGIGAVEEQKSTSQKKFGFAPGLQFSIFGIAPSFSVQYKEFEVDSKFYITSDIEENETISFLSNIIIGYNSNPFSYGYQNLIGFSYYISNTNFVTVLKDMGSFEYIPEGSFMQIAGIGYRGSIQWRNGLNLNFNVNIPLFMLFLGGDEVFTAGIHNGPEGFAYSILGSHVGINVGIKYSF